MIALTHLLTRLSETHETQRETRDRHLWHALLSETHLHAAPGTSSVITNAMLAELGARLMPAAEHLRQAVEVDPPTDHRENLKQLPATGAELARLDHGGPVCAVAFSPDGTRVATGSDDDSARVFEVEVGALIQRALCVMTRALNTVELRRYSLPPDCGHVKLWNERSARPAL